MPKQMKPIITDLLDYLFLVDLREAHSDILSQHFLRLLHLDFLN